MAPRQIKKAVKPKKRESVLHFEEDKLHALSVLINGMRSFIICSTNLDNKVRYIRQEGKMVLHLYSLFNGIPFEDMPDKVQPHHIAELEQAITKADGSLMTDEHQLTMLCAHLAKKEGSRVIGRLYGENNYHPKFWTSLAEGDFYIIVIKFNEENSYGTSTRQNVYCPRSTMYCIFCRITYSNKSDHTSRCKGECSDCYGRGEGFPCVQTFPSGGWRKCTRCNLDFKSEACYSSHLKLACHKREKCTICGIPYLIAKGPHVCGTQFCRNCSQRDPKNDPRNDKNHCFIRKAKINKKADFCRDLYVIFDAETIQQMIDFVERKRVYLNDDESFEPASKQACESTRNRRCGTHRNEQGETQQDVPMDGNITRVSNMFNDYHELIQRKMPLLNIREHPKATNGILRGADDPTVNKRLNDLIHEIRGSDRTKKMNFIHVVNLLS